MFQKLKTLLTGKEGEKLLTAEQDFDQLMDTLDKDQVDLEKLERHVQEEFDDLGGDVEEISREIDEVVEKKKPAAVK